MNRNEFADSNRRTSNLVFFGLSGFITAWDSSSKEIRAINDAKTPHLDSGLHHPTQIPGSRVLVVTHKMRA